MVKVSPADRKRARLTSAQRLEEIRIRHQEELEQEKKRESKIAVLLSGIGLIDQGKLAAGKAIIELRDLGLKMKEIEEMSGLTSKDQNLFVSFVEEYSESESDDDAELPDETTEDSEPAEKEIKAESPLDAVENSVSKL